MTLAHAAAVQQEMAADDAGVGAGSTGIVRSRQKCFTEKTVLESSGGLGVFKESSSRETSCAPQRRLAPPQELVRWNEA
eukprot:5053751-Prymnesium_polylepis.1